MLPADLPENHGLEQCLKLDGNKRIRLLCRMSGARFHSMGLSLQDIDAVLSLVKVDRSH